MARTNDQVRPGSQGVYRSQLLASAYARSAKAQSLDEAIKIVHEAVEAGVNFMDNAAAYDRRLRQQSAFDGSSPSVVGMDRRIAQCGCGNMFDDRLKAAGRRPVISASLATVRRIDGEWVDRIALCSLSRFEMRYLLSKNTSHAQRLS